VCRRWRSFKNFISDMKKRPTALHTLERNDNNGDYTPKNCRWATRKEQSNNRRSTVRVFVDGFKIPIAEAARRIGINYDTLYARLSRGWNDEKAIKTTPTKQFRMIAFQGETFSLRGWARILGIGANTLRKRLKNNWSLARALTPTKYNTNGRPI
jgi:DNA invertase Pin-like site-specific DNA recombinase